MSKTVTFDANGYIEIDGHIFEDPAEARKYVKLNNGQTWDPALVVPDPENPGQTIDNNEFQDFATTAKLSTRTSLFEGTTVQYTAEYTVENIDHVNCAEYPGSGGIPPFGNVGAFFY